MKFISIITDQYLNIFSDINEKIITWQLYEDERIAPIKVMFIISYGMSEPNNYRYGNCTGII